jgi:hypothetical protein
MFIISTVVKPRNGRAGYVQWTAQHVITGLARYHEKVVSSTPGEGATFCFPYTWLFLNRNIFNKQLTFFQR